jgi:cytochrome c2
MKHDLILPLRSSLFLRLFSVLFLSLLCTSAWAQVDMAKGKEGKDLFKANCASCHNLKSDGTGPALGGVVDRWTAAGDFKGKSGEQWLKLWIKNWNTPVEAGYKYAVDMANSRPTQMNLFTSLSDENIDKIIYYIQNSDKLSPAPAAATTTAAGGAETAKAEEGNSWGVIAIVVLLITLTVILVATTRRLETIIAQNKGEKLTESAPFYKGTRFKVAMLLLGIIYLGYVTMDATISLGRQQGYQPAQPIKFSHKLHAGKHKIECQYCHSTADKSKHSNIPSVNTCMNCHKQVSSGPQYGTKEIAKIYEAAGWDPAKKAYTGTPKPIEWVRIHNMPDHVYFNHAQHVVAGKVACQTCHGPIETMDEVYQYSPLSMGWCINCHRQTEVQFASNQYYQTYEKLHQDLKDKKLKKVTVETIGGTECQRCHY